MPSRKRLWTDQLPCPWARKCFPAVLGLYVFFASSGLEKALEHLNLTAIGQEYGL